MKRLIIGLLCLCGAAVAHADAMSSPEKFTEEYVAMLRVKFPKAEAKVVKPLEVRIKLENGTESTAFLENAYKEVQRDPANKIPILERYIGSITDLATNKEGIEKTNIVAVVKDRGWLAEIRKAKGVPFEYIHEELNEDLVIIYAEDTPSNIRYFGEKTLGDAGIERKNLRELAMDNLRRILPDLEREEIGGVSRLSAGGDYDASLLLFDDLWTEDVLKIKGEIVVGLPARNVLLFVPAADRARVKELERLVHQVIEEDNRPLTEQLFVYRKGKFQRYSP